MFTINISFKDALTCFETLSDIKPTEELKSIESEFVKYAKQKARVGDSAAEAWLKNNAKVEAPKAAPETSGEPSPMSFFIGMERPAIKDKQMEALEKGLFYDDMERSSLEVELDDEHDVYVEEKRTLEKPVPVDLTRQSIEKALKPLDALVGLGQIKKQVRRIFESKIIDQRRIKAGLKTIGNSSNHMVFTGNPGTGKTTVARIVAEIFKELGFLSKGHLTEVTRSDLVGEYIGQTEQITKDVLRSAVGGVLFVDEAYNLHRPHSQNDYGQDAISTLMKQMEDKRDDLIVIMAGYSDLMGDFLRSNPGLKSRVPHHLDFSDMKADHLLEVFKIMCKDHDYMLDDKAEKAVLSYLKHAKRQEISEFPNGRGVRNLFENVIRRQAERLLEKNYRAKKKLKELLLEDIPSYKAEKDGNVIQLPRN